MQKAQNTLKSNAYYKVNDVLTFAKDNQIYFKKFQRVPCSLPAAIMQQSNMSSLMTNYGRFTLCLLPMVQVTKHYKGLPPLKQLNHVITFF